MNRKRIYIVGGLLAVLVVTAALVVVALVLAGGKEPAQAAGPLERAFGMTSDEVVVGEEPTEECPVVQVTIEGSGHASHLASVAVTRTHCFDPDSDPAITDGRWEAVAENGDRVWGSYFGHLVASEFDAEGKPVRGTITSPYTLEGGTGRFEGATGEGITTGDLDLVAEEGRFRTEGWIWY